MSPFPSSSSHQEKFSAIALLHVKLIKCYGLHPWSSLISPLINTTVTSLFPIQHGTHFLLDYYMWYLVPFYSFSTDMHEETNVSFVIQQFSPSIQSSD